MSSAEYTKEPNMMKWMVKTVTVAGPPCEDDKVGAAVVAELEQQFDIFIDQLDETIRDEFPELKVMVSD